ncbi:MAG: TetR/AcrR family transcriptional regulator [Thermomicrobiales bacterium]|nr:TetR/AcrR family transcriptional regulator [Thermomicrobiales bacterium]
MEPQVTPRRIDAVENAERVLIAALELYDERGLQAEVREIAARAGVGVGTVYRNFPTKDDLTNAVLQQLVDRWSASLIEAETTEDSIGALRALLAHGLELIRRHQWLMELSMQPQAVQPSTIEKMREMMSLQQEALGRIIARAIDQGEIRAGIDVPLVAALLSAAAHPNVFEQAGAGRSVNEVADSLLALLRDGIGA